MILSVGKLVRWADHQGEAYTIHTTDFYIWLRISDVCSETTPEWCKVTSLSVCSGVHFMHVQCVGLCVLNA